LQSYNADNILKLARAVTARLQSTTLLGSTEFL